MQNKEIEIFTLGLSVLSIQGLHLFKYFQFVVFNHTYNNEIVLQF